jgi:hypothetical protein
MINTIKTADPQQHTPYAGGEFNAEHVYKDRPVRDRPGSELTDPDAPIVRTREGYKSVLVKRLGKDAYLRISPSGYRLISKSPRSGKFVMQGSSQTGWLHGQHSVGAMVSMIRSNPDLKAVLPKGTAEALSKLVAVVPNAGVAYNAVSDFQYKANWLDDDVKQALLNTRGW